MPNTKPKVVNAPNSAKTKHPTVYITRHGKTKANGGNATPETVRGWEDVPLNTEGREQAKAAGERLKRLGINITHIFTSDQARGKDTGHIISNVLGGVAVTPSWKLRSWGLGVLEGKKVSEVRGTQNWFQTHPKKRIPKAETYEEFLKRATEALNLIFNFAKKNPNEAVLVVTHSKVLLALRNVLTKGKAKIPFTGEPNPTQIQAIEFTDDNHIRIRNVN